MIEKNNPKIIRAWTMYDWANSAYNLVITSTIFPIYYNQATRKAFGGETVQFLGMSIENTVLYTYAISFAFLVVLLMSPLLAGIADFGGRKKVFMQIFSYLGAFACMSLALFTGENIELGISMAVLAMMGYAGSLVFYNAFLHDIATPDQTDSVSARGYSMGYIGSVILFLLNLVMIKNKELLGITDGQAARLSFATTGLWWIGFAQIMFFGVPEVKKSVQFTSKMITKGYQELFKVLQQIRQQSTIQTYLVAFFFYNMGVQTIMLLAATFGEKELHMESNELITTVLVLQLIAVVGSFAFAWVSKKYGNKMAIMIMLVIWIGVCLAAYKVTTSNEFYALAVVIGLIMGGIQSLSRATYSKLIPENTHDSASYFSFYDVVEKSSIVLGTFCYGLLEQLTGSMRNSALLLGLFFLVGLFIMNKVVSPALKGEKS
jgi:UMF1 family MFS transporter